MTVDFSLPHVPLLATPKWFDLYPEDEVILPRMLLDDRNDTRRFSRYDGDQPRSTAIYRDLPPTFLNWADVPVPASYQGVSLKPVIEGGPEPKECREDFFCEHSNRRYAISWLVVRGQRFKYARYVDQEPVFEYLHDLQNAPNELINLAGNEQHRSLLKQMRQRTDALAEDYAKALTATVSPSRKPGNRDAIQRIHQ